MAALLKIALDSCQLRHLFQRARSSRPSGAPATERLFWTTGCGLAGFASDYKFRTGSEGHWTAYTVPYASTCKKDPWLGWSRGEMAMPLARCFPLLCLWMYQFPTSSGRCFPLLIMSCVGCLLNRSGLQHAVRQPKRDDIVPAGHRSAHERRKS